MENGVRRIECICMCGEVRAPRAKDLKSGNNTACLSCSGKRRNKKEKEDNPDLWLKRLKRASDIAAQNATQRRIYTDYGRSIRFIVTGMKQRCTNPKNTAYKNYGGRGIKFGFTSIKEAVMWIENNLPKREVSQSIERIDNNGDYAPGNLKWATVIEQANNKRQYVRSPNGERIRMLQASGVDLVYETIRSLIKKGLTDDEIKNRKPKFTGRPRTGVRHTKLRS